MKPTLEQLEALLEIECETHRHDLETLATERRTHLQDAMEISALNEQLIERTEQHYRLRAFAREMFELADWPEGGDIDGFAFQDTAVKHGLLIEETRTERCGEKCYCADEYHGEDAMREGVTCYRKSQWLTE